MQMSRFWFFPHDALRTVSNTAWLLLLNLIFFISSCAFIYTGSERSAEFSTLAGLSRDWNLTNNHEPRPGRVGIHVHESVKKFAFMVTLRLKLRFIYSIMCQDWYPNYGRIVGS